MLWYFLEWSIEILLEKHDKLNPLEYLKHFLFNSLTLSCDFVIITSNVGNIKFQASKSE